MEDIFKILKEVGLTDGESKIYYALVKIGTSSITRVIEYSGVSASKCYQILDRLIGKGLVGMSIINKVRHYTALPVYKLIEMLDEKENKIKEQKEKIKDILPTLQAMQNDNVENLPIIEFVEGKTAIENVLDEMIESAPPGSKYQAIAGSRISFRLQSIWFLLNQKLNNKNIRQENIYDYETWFKKDPKVHRRSERKNFYPKIFPKKYKDMPNIAMVGDKTIIKDIDDKNKPFGLIIRNKRLTDSLRKLFEFIYDHTDNPLEIE